MTDQRHDTVLSAVARTLTKLRSAVLSSRCDLSCLSTAWFDPASGLAGDDIDPEEYTPEVLDGAVPMAIKHLVEVTNVVVLHEMLC